MSKPSSNGKKPTLADLPVQIMLAVLGALLLSWPILQLVGDRGAHRLFQYVMVVWSLLILVLVLLGRAIARHASAPDSALPDEPSASKEKVS